MSKQNGYISWVYHIDGYISLFFIHQIKLRGKLNIGLRLGE